MIKAIFALSISDPALSAEIQCQWQICKAVNHIHVQQLDSIEKLPGFTGTQGIGVSDIPSGVDDEEKLEADLNGVRGHSALFH